MLVYHRKMPTYRLTAKKIFLYKPYRKTFRKGCCVQKNTVCVIFSPLVVDLMWHLIGLQYSKTCLKRPLKNRQNKGLKDKW